MNTRSKRTFLTTLLLGPALLAIALVLSTDKPASGAGGGGSSFAENITGVWLSNPDPPGPFFQVGFQILTHFHADGTMFWSHNREYGGVGFGKDGAVYCIWEQTDLLGLEPSPPQQNPADAQEYRWQMDSPLGALSSLRPAVSLSHTPPRWRSPPVPPGSDAPQWLPA